MTYAEALANHGAATQAVELAYEAYRPLKLAHLAGTADMNEWQAARRAYDKALADWDAADLILRDMPEPPPAPADDPQRSLFV